MEYRGGSCSCSLDGVRLFSAKRFLEVVEVKAAKTLPRTRSSASAE